MVKIYGSVLFRCTSSVRFGCGSVLFRFSSGVPFRLVQPCSSIWFGCTARYWFGVAYEFGSVRISIEAGEVIMAGRCTISRWELLCIRVTVFGVSH